MAQEHLRELRTDETFWREVFGLRGSVTPHLLNRVFAFGLLALLVYLVDKYYYSLVHFDLAPYEIGGVVLGFLLVFRINAGYDRWYEGRKMLGGIVNETRNLTVTSLTHGPADPVWRESITRWIACYGHICRVHLRGEGVPSQVRALLGNNWSDEIAGSKHMPSFVALRIGDFLRQACDDMGMDHFGFLRADQERARLIEFVGCCERIQKTPIPRAYSINIRRLIFLYLALTPFALIVPLGWGTPLVTMLIAYPVLSVDQIGVELQNPFGTDSLNHLPFDDLSANIEADVMGILAADQNAANARR